MLSTIAAEESGTAPAPLLVPLALSAPIAQVLGIP
jgi:hypothetical protein